MQTTTTRETDTRPDLDGNRLRLQVRSHPRSQIVSHHSNTASSNKRSAVRTTRGGDATALRAMHTRMAEPPEASVRRLFPPMLKTFANQQRIPAVNKAR